MDYQGTPTQEDLLGGGTPWAKFVIVGDRASGIIVSEPVIRQQTSYPDGVPMHWPDGKPKYEIIATLDTGQSQDEHGNTHLDVYIKGKMLQALRMELRNKRAAKLHIGGRLVVTYVGDEKPSGRAVFAAKVYTVEYFPPAPEVTQETMFSATVDDLTAEQRAVLRTAGLA
jgi:hypothetical protein